MAQRGLNLDLSRTTDAADADLSDAGDMPHFARPTHGTGVTVSLALNLIAPVDMRVDL